jgi:hypothetical protein
MPISDVQANRANQENKVGTGDSAHEKREKKRDCRIIAKAQPVKEKEKNAPQDTVTSKGAFWFRNGVGEGGEGAFFFHD